jgi:hypothetical protein
MGPENVSRAPILALIHPYPQALSKLLTFKHKRQEIARSVAGMKV